MKYFALEATSKKSIVEFTLFKRKDEEGNTINLRKELGWRWGTFKISVPETEEEAMKHIKAQGYDDVLEWASDHGHSEMVVDTEVLPEDFALVEAIRQDVVPSENDEFVDLTEDYDAEMIECSDGCWEYWHVSSYQRDIDDEEQETIIEGVEAAYDENYEEGVEDLGWEYVATYFEMHCSPKITECDENGNISA